MTEVLLIRNQFIYLLCKSMDWFLYDRDLRNERVKLITFADYARGFIIESARQRCIQIPGRHLRGSFFGNIAMGFQSLTIFGKKFQLRCMTRFRMHFFSFECICSNDNRKNELGCFRVRCIF